MEDRSPWQWLGGYLVAAWIALQVTDTLASILGLPLWFGRAVLVLVGMGVPLVLVTAAVQWWHRAGTRTGSGRLPRLFSWRNAALGALVSFALLGFGTAGHLTARSLGIGPLGTLMARGILPDDAELVLADLEDHAGDGEAARALTQALRAHLGQSSSVFLASPSRVTAALERMDAGADARLDLERAREVAIREGLKAVVAGEIHSIGSQWVVSVSLIAAGSGDELFTGIETVSGSSELIGAVERLSLRLRERIGESLASVRRSPPLSRVRTASLPALKSFTEAAAANGRGDFERCVLLNEEAIGLDSLFAMAYVGRAACNQNLGRDPALQVSDRVRAYQLRDRMTERERLQFTAVYHQFVARDRERAVQAWETYAARHPDDAPARFALANLYAEGREWGRAETTLLEGLDLDPSRVIVLLNLSGYQLNMGRYDDAEATLRRLNREQPAFDLARWRTVVHYSRGDLDSAEEEIMAALERLRGHPGQRAPVAALAALVVATRGRLDEADRLFLDAAAADSSAGNPAGVLRALLARASLYLESRGDTLGALALLEDARARSRWDELPPAGRPHLDAAGILAAAGRPTAAREELDRWRGDLIPGSPGAAGPAWLTAAIARAEGRLADALIEWRREDTDREDPVLPLLAMGLLHDRIGRTDSAVHYLERYLGTPSRARHFTDPYWRGRVLQRLATLYEERGESGRAAARSRELIELWQDADPVLQPRVAEARARLTRLDG